MVYSSIEIFIRLFLSLLLTDNPSIGCELMYRSFACSSVTSLMHVCSLFLIIFQILELTAPVWWTCFCLFDDCSLAYLSVCFFIPSFVCLMNLFVFVWWLFSLYVFSFLRLFIWGCSFVQLFVPTVILSFIFSLSWSFFFYHS